MNYWFFAAYVAGIFMITGLVLIFTNHFLSVQRQKKMQRFLAVDILARTKKMALSLLNESMDLIPEKIAEAQKIMDNLES